MTWSRRRSDGATCYADNYTLENEMIACAEWLGRDHTTCTRKPDGCACEPKEPVCTCSDGPYHYSSCQMYKEGHDPFAALGKAMTKHAPTPNPYCGIKGGCTTWCGDIACKRHNAELCGGTSATNAVLNGKT